MSHKRVFALLTPEKLQLKTAKCCKKPMFALPGGQPISVNTLLCDTSGLPFALFCALLHSFACFCVRPRLERPNLGTAEILLKITKLWHFRDNLVSFQQFFLIFSAGRFESGTLQAVFSIFFGIFAMPGRFPPSCKGEAKSQATLHRSTDYIISSASTTKHLLERCDL